jgi:uncharacterized protein DUF4114/PEP-CTERM motif-containing protein
MPIRNFLGKAKPAGALAALVLGLALSHATAIAAPILGQQIYYEGGDVQVTVLPYSAAYTSQLILFSTPSPLVIANSSQVGQVVNLGDLAALYGITPGSELIFGILVLNTGNTFKMGPGGRNLDGVEHVTVDYAEDASGEDIALLGFEDLFGGGDQDYNDANFQLEGGIGFVQRTPEPSSLVLLVLGLAGLGAWSRSLFRGARPQHLNCSLK